VLLVQRERPAVAAEWTTQQLADLRAEVGPDRVIQFKEVGLPTASERRVRQGGRAATRRCKPAGVPFAFEAFDQ
jgi:hypothetical protein